MWRGVVGSFRSRCKCMCYEPTWPHPTCSHNARTTRKLISTLYLCLLVTRHCIQYTFLGVLQLAHRLQVHFLAPQHIHQTHGIFERSQCNLSLLFQLLHLCLPCWWSSVCVVSYCCVSEALHLLVGPLQLQGPLLQLLLQATPILVTVC